jgi:hypothetical protein
MKRWNSGAEWTFKIPISKHQIANKSQIPILNDQNKFGILVIVICPSTWLRVVSLSNHLIFAICDLEFYSSNQ